MQLMLEFTDDTSLVVNLGSAGGIKVRAADPTEEEIYGPGGYLERIRSAWSEEERLARMSAASGVPRIRHPRRGAAAHTGGIGSPAGRGS
jgi:hypothetical protein